MQYSRAAFLPDTFHEINGVAHTSRHLEAFARRHQIPFLSMHCGPKEERLENGCVSVVQLKRGPAKIGLDAHLDYDPFLLRYCKQAEENIRRFGADLIHITGPGDMGILGYVVARRLSIPLLMSWHTSLHEYAARRLERMLFFLNRRINTTLCQIAERVAWAILTRFYKKATVILAPNPDLVSKLSESTGRPVFLMKRGVDTDLFNPTRRPRTTHPFRLGYVGRLTAEKNVRFFADLGRALQLLNRQFEFVIVGEGREEQWLREHVPNAIFTGVLKDESLAEMYASMDLFVFPSHTDTFGNVVLEALASGVPTVVTGSGGPQFLVKDGITGFVARSDRDIIGAVHDVFLDPTLHRRMRVAAREDALTQSWDTVLEQVFRAYDGCRPANVPVQHPALGSA